MTTAYAVWALVAPSRWPLWLTLLAALLAIGGRLSARQMRVALVAIAALWLVIGVSPLGIWLIRPLEQRYAATAAGPPVKNIVMLTGAELLHESAHAGRLEVGQGGERVLAGAALAHRYPGATLWAVGGVRLERDGPADIDWVAAQWADMGVAPARIRTIGNTLNTCRNAEGVRRAGTDDGFLLVTSAHHMARAMACMQHQGLAPRPWPVDYRGVSARGFDPVARAQLVDIAMHEYVGLLVYRLTGRIETMWLR